MWVISDTHFFQIAVSQNELLQHSFCSDTLYSTPTLCCCVQNYIVPRGSAQRCVNTEVLKANHITYILKAVASKVYRKIPDTMCPVGGVSEAENMSIMKHEYLRVVVLDLMSELKMCSTEAP